MQIFPKNIGIMLPYLKEHTKQLIIASILSVIFAFIQLPLPLIIKHFLDYTIHQKHISAFIYITSLLIGLTLIASLVGYFSQIFFTKANNTVALSLKKMLLNQILHAPSSEIAKHGWGYYMSRIEDDTAGIQSFFVDNILSMATTFLTVLVSFVAAFILCYYLGLSFLPIIVLILLLTIRQKKIISQELSIFRENEAKKTEELGESLHLMPFTKTASNTKYSFSKYVSALQGSLQSLLSYTYKYQKTSTGIGMITEMGSHLVVFGLGGYLILHNVITIGTLLAVNNFSGNIIGGIRTLVNQYYQLQKAFVSFDRIKEIMDLPQEIPNEERAAVLEIRSIRLENIQIKHGDKTIFQDFSFSCKSGDRVLITGASGIGKTTLLKAMIGILALQSGKIYINEDEVSSQDLCTFRLKMGFLEQEPVLANDTISNNITIVYPQATQQEINQAAQEAFLEDFVRDREDDLQALIGPNGNRLSIGQKQRLALARTLIRKPKLLLLDEPLSNVDPKSEEFILETIKQLPEDVIVLMISHKAVPEGIFNKYLCIGNDATEIKM